MKILSQIHRENANLSDQVSNLTTALNKLTETLQNQHAQLNESIRGELIAGIEALPMSIASDEAAYEILRDRLLEDVEAAFDLGSAGGRRQ